MLSLKVRTERLELIAETVELAAAESAGRQQLSAALDADVPEDWPPDELADATELFAAKLRQNPSWAGWLNWYWILVDPASGRRTLIGSGGFTSPPVDGTVATGYSLLPAYQRKGYATEAVLALIAWAFSHAEVGRIIAETLPDNEPSIRVLLRAGFRPGGKASEPGHVRFILKRL
jgi:RimJ/RimL family protein N-acetyltransferase